MHIILVDAGFDSQTVDLREFCESRGIKIIEKKFTPMPCVIVLPEDLERDTKVIPCPVCNGFCDESTMTKEEIKQHDCGKGYQCCSKAFECRICQARIIAKLEAPEMY